MFDNSFYFFTKNYNYSITSIINHNQQVVESYSYSPYGIITIKDQNGHDISQSNFNNTITYTGRRLDTESNLYYYRNRMYSAELGRFLSKDPKGYVDGTNLYAYVKNNPLRYLDPMGTKSLESAFNEAEAQFERLENITNSGGSSSDLSLMLTAYNNAQAFIDSPEIQSIVNDSSNRYASNSVGVTPNWLKNNGEYHSDAFIEASVPEVEDKGLEFVKENAGIGIAIAGGFATGGTAWALWGIGTYMDVSTAIKKEDESYMYGIVAIPGTGTIGTVWAVGNAIFNTHMREDKKETNNAE